MFKKSLFYTQVEQMILLQPKKLAKGYSQSKFDSAFEQKAYRHRRAALNLRVADPALSFSSYFNQSQLRARRARSPEVPEKLLP